MKNNIGQVTVEFNKKALKLFTFWYRMYQDTRINLPEKKDEKSFHQLSNQYIHTLKHQLDETALSIMDKYKFAIDNMMYLQRTLTGQINFYLNEFSRKAALL